MAVILQTTGDKIQQRTCVAVGDAARGRRIRTTSTYLNLHSFHSTRGIIVVVIVGVTVVGVLGQVQRQHLRGQTEG